RTDRSVEAGCSLMDLLTSPLIVDSWGTPLRADPAWNGQSTAVRSAGPDGRFGSQDDLVQSLIGCGSSGNIEVRIDHDQDTQNGAAAAAGIVLDTAGAVVAGATVRVLEQSSGRVHQVRTDPQGTFRIAAVPAGGYRIEVSMPGFQTARRSIRLEQR